MDEQLPDSGIELSAAEIEAIDTRWTSCWTPREIARRLTGTAAAARPKDQADFDTTVPLMTAAQRETLAELLARAPAHRWLATAGSAWTGSGRRGDRGKPAGQIGKSVPPGPSDEPDHHGTARAVRVVSITRHSPSAVGSRSNGTGRRRTARAPPRRGWHR
jgi:hypothetical protein